jgi:segregation and condensation protein B
MTDHPNPPRSADRVPAWMTLPGSLTSPPPEPPATSDEPAAPEPAATSEPAWEPSVTSDEPVAPEPSVTPGAPAASALSAGSGGRVTLEAPVGADESSAPESPVLSGGPASEEDPDTGEAAASPDGEGPGLKAGLEAILLVVDEPVAEVTLAQVLERPTHEVSAALRELAEEYTASGRGFDLREVAGGWRYYTRADCATLVERFVRDGQQTRLTQAALETLAVVAYRQPVSRARVAAVRGVNSDGVMRTLVARGLVEEAGTDPESQAMLYRTSSYFLERLGLRDIGELPELAPFLPDDVENLEENTK